MRLLTFASLIFISTAVAYGQVTERTIVSVTGATGAGFSSWTGVSANGESYSGSGETQRGFAGVIGGFGDVASVGANGSFVTETDLFGNPLVETSFGWSASFRLPEFGSSSALDQSFVSNNGFISMTVTFWDPMTPVGDPRVVVERWATPPGGLPIEATVLTTGPFPDPLNNPNALFEARNAMVRSAPMATAIPEPSSLTVWGILAALSCTFGYRTRRLRQCRELSGVS